MCGELFVDLNIFKIRIPTEVIGPTVVGPTVVENTAMTRTGIVSLFYSETHIIIIILTSIQL